MSSAVTLITVPDLASTRGLVAPKRLAWRVGRALRRSEASWVAVVQGPETPPRVLEQPGALEELRAALDGRSGPLLFFRYRRAKEVIPSVAAIFAETQGADRFLVLLPEREPSPVERARYHPVHGFACDAESARALLSRADEDPAELTYHAATWAIETEAPLRLLVRQVPLFRPLPAATAGDASLRIVIPHRGNLSHLTECLRHVVRAASSLREPRIHVALDQEIDEQALELVGRFPAARFWRVSPPQSGPYVPRHILGTSAEEEFVSLQDSDDVPCSDRFSTSLARIRDGAVDVIGSHTLDVDERKKIVRPHRYPVDASAPLRERPQNTMFHPTLMMRTAALQAAGGFSTVRRFASDREFNLRAYFHSLRLGNVDEFLYLRRVRSDSLVHSQATGMKSTVRQELHDAWHRDFAEIQGGRLALEDSSLAPHHLDPLPELIPVDGESSERPR